MSVRLLVSRLGSRAVHAQRRMVSVHDSYNLALLH